MAVRAVRGATQLEADDRDHLLERVAEMVTDVMRSNGLVVDDFISVIFTATSDLRPWQQHVLSAGDDELRITSVPGVHGPGPLARVLPPVMGSVVELVHGGDVAWRGYISGDTLYRPFLGEVLERCGPLDVLIPHLGGTKALGLTVTMDARQGADLVELLKPPVTVPVHFDDYDRFKSPLGDFVAEVAKRQVPGEIRTVGRGQTVSLRA